MLAMTLSEATLAQCTAESGARRVALLEHYTSEGCDSCPPADRWVSSLAGRGLGLERVVTLGFHVDYWNYLGWSDPFARAEYSLRQRVASRRNQARVVYTPQLLLNGRNYRRGVIREDITDRVMAFNRDMPKARISLRIAADPPDSISVQGAATVPDRAARDRARAYVALYENNLATQVAAGENRGKHLRHDYVVRNLSGPYSLDAQGSAALIQRYRLAPGWKPRDLHIAAFVQDESSGDVLQALAIPYCP